jgi:hypothetical protein
MRLFGFFFLGTGFCVFLLVPRKLGILFQENLDDFCIKKPALAERADLLYNGYSKWRYQHHLRV